jgi:tetratricopeptide (TPR) repeat protein
MAESNPQNARAQSLFKTGTDAAMKGNYDYAIQMLQDCCKLVPGNLVFRQTLRGTERRKFGDDPKKVGRMVGAKNHPIRARAKVAKAKSQWTYVLEVCEEAFVHNPWDVTASELAADAAEKLEMMDVAQWLLESVSAIANDADFFRHIAHVYEETKQFNKAIQSWERVKQIVPLDENASRQINALSASGTIMRAGLEDAIDRANAPPETEVVAAPTAEEIRIKALTPEQRMLKEIQDDPKRVSGYLDLADHFKLHGRLDDAEKVLRAGLKSIPEDTLLKTLHSEMMMARMRKHIDALSTKAETDPTARAKRDELVEKLSEYEMAELRRLIAASADDAELHLKLGLCLAKVGQHEAAIAEFQKARAAPELRAAALLQTGLSFEANGIVKLAERSYQDALKSLDIGDPANQDAINELHYRLGRVAEALGNYQSAEEHYNEVAANDYGYLDVAQRLRNLNAGPSL